VLIFTQMTKMLDILENFLNLHNYIYVRLDGSVKVEQRQRLVDRFNLNSRIFCFISSTRCGGIGINLTGADCVIFYDTDWNPAMDKQAQDRCHRIGQTKTVHIYRLISGNTIEENIFKKSLHKREMEKLIIEGNFDMELFKKVSVKEILEDGNLLKPKPKDLLKEENFTFHSVLGEENEGDVDFEKQKQIESYRKKFEEALVRIEDVEDVAAFQQAKKEIADEFEEEEEEEKKEKNEVVNWRTHQGLNDVTKLCIGQYEQSYSFEQYMEDRAKKDSKFVNPDKEAAKKEGDEGEESDFSLSEESNKGEGEDGWDREEAERLYGATRSEIKSKYFIE